MTKSLALASQSQCIALSLTLFWLTTTDAAARLLALGRVRTQRNAHEGGINDVAFPAAQGVIFESV